MAWEVWRFRANWYAFPVPTTQLADLPIFFFFFFFSFPIFACLTRDRNGLRTCTYINISWSMIRTFYPPCVVLPHPNIQSIPYIPSEISLSIQKLLLTSVILLWERGGREVKLMFYINSHWSLVAVLSRSHLTSPRASNYGWQDPRKFLSFPQTPQPLFLGQTHLVWNRHGTIMAQSPYRPYVLSKNMKLGEGSGIALLAPKVRMHPLNRYCYYFFNGLRQLCVTTKTASPATPINS